MRGCAVPTELPNECRARQIKLARSRARSAGDVAAFSRPRRRSRADPPSLRSRDNWHSGDAALRQGAWAQGAIAADHLGAACQHADARNRGGARRRFLAARQGRSRQALVQSPLAPRPTLMTRAEFEAAWNGHLVLMTRRAGLVDLSRRFDITWFLGAVHKYRRLLGEVLVASFFLQLFALVSPLFFQVVIDKVLVHRT